MPNYKGKIYKSFKALCDAFKMNDSTVRARLNLGWSLSEALGTTKRENKSRYNAKKIAINVHDPTAGMISFQSIKQATEHYNLNYNLVIQRLKKHSWLIEQALGLEPPPKRKAHNRLFIEIDGRVFDSRSECAEYYGVDQRLVFTRLKRDWPLKEALGVVKRTPKTLSPHYKCNIYKVINLLNGKSYVGVTVNTIQERFTQHVYMSTSRSSSGSLQSAIYRHGREKFSIELLEVSELQDLSSKEKNWISVSGSIAPSGYNLNSGGAGIGGAYSSVGISFNGKTFSSISDLARKNSIKPQTLNARLRKMSLEQAMKKPFRKSPKTR